MLGVTALVSIFVAVICVLIEVYAEYVAASTAYVGIILNAAQDIVLS